MKTLGQLWIAAFLCAACGSTPTSRFYVLTPVEESLGESSESIPIRIAPIELPKYLRGPEMITRRERNRVEHASYDRWAEPLADGFERILGANLARLVPSEHVVSGPWVGTVDNERVVHVFVQRFDVENQSAQLEATWSLSSSMPSTGELHRANFVSRLEGEDAAATARAMSQVLGELSLEIARAIRPAGE